MKNTQDKNQFIALIEEMDAGDVAREIDAKLREAISASGNLGSPAEVTIKLKLKPIGGGKSKVLATVTNKVPTETRDPSLFYFGRDGDTLQRQHPDQLEFPADKVTEMPGAKSA